MGKILLAIVVGLVIYLLLRAARRPVRSGDMSPPTGQDEAMVRCARCGIHLPTSESVVEGETHFCSEEHRRLGRS